MRMLSPREGPAFFANPHATVYLLKAATDTTGFEAPRPALCLVRPTEQQGWTVAIQPRFAGRRVRIGSDGWSRPDDVGFVTSRKHWMKSSAAGLSVRFLSETIA